MSEFIDHQTNQVVKKTSGEIILDRVGKIENGAEVYSNRKEILTVCDNDYSILLSEKNSRKYAFIRIYWGVADVTHLFFKGDKNPRIKADVIYEFVNKVGSLPNETFKGWK